MGKVPQHKKLCRLNVQHYRKQLEAKYPDCLHLETVVDLSKVDKVILKEFVCHVCEETEADRSSTFWHAF